MCTSGKVQLWVRSTEQENRIQRATCTFVLSEYERTLKRTMVEIMVDMAAWFGDLNINFLASISIFSGVFLGISVLSLVEILFWFLKAFTGMWRCKYLLL